MKRCSKCILPEQFPRISFDENGVCNYCHSFEMKWPQYDWDAKKSDLETLIDRIKSKKRRYDCLVPISGGRDSSYTLYLCAKKYKMNVLAINFDNGFSSQIASQNLAQLAKKFDVDFVSWAPKWSTLKLAYRTFFLRTGNFCPPCSRAITAYTYRLAQKENIPIIVLGFNPKTDENPSEVEIIDQKLFKDVIGNEMSKRNQMDFTMFEGRRLLTKRIDMPAYIPFIEKDITKVLESELCLDGHFSGDMHFDCKMSPVANWLRRRKWGFGKKTQKYSLLIRDGQMTREEALEKAEGPDADKEPEILKEFMELLDLTRDDIMRAKELSPLNYKHYNYKLIRLVENILRNT